MKKGLRKLLLPIIFLAGLSLLLYPTISEYYNTWLRSRAIAEYSDQVDQMEQEKYDAHRAAAHAYNDKLALRATPYELPGELEEEYWSLLDLSIHGIMAYIEIPAIGVTLPIAHGTEKDTLAEYVGHMQWSALPVGGEGTHSVLSGHRGLPTSELFTNIDHLGLGDVFYVHVLDETLKYRVDNIAIVDPYDYRFLAPVEGEDYMTLVTCTPYGINSHRLLVRGSRVPDDGDGHVLTVSNEVVAIEMKYIVPVTMAVLSLPGLGVFLIVSGKTGKKSREEGHEDTETIYGYLDTVADADRFNQRS